MANTPQSYTDRFRLLTPEKLAAIIVNAGEYHLDAVKAARLELTARMLPKEELDRIYALAEEEKTTAIVAIEMQAPQENQTSSTPVTSTTSIWGRTTSLKLILVYFITVPIGMLAYGADEYYHANTNISGSFILLLAPVLFLLIYGFVIWMGQKGYSFIYFTVALLLSFPITSGVVDYFHSQKISRLIPNAEHPAAVFLPNLYFSGLKILIPGMLLILLLRRDTRVACGIAKG